MRVVVMVTKYSWWEGSLWAAGWFLISFCVRSDKGGLVFVALVPLVVPGISVNANEDVKCWNCEVGIYRMTLKNKKTKQTSCCEVLLIMTSDEVICGLLHLIHKGSIV